MIPTIGGTEGDHKEPYSG